MNKENEWDRRRKIEIIVKLEELIKFEKEIEKKSSLEIEGDFEGCDEDEC